MVNIQMKAVIHCIAYTQTKILNGEKSLICILGDDFCFGSVFLMNTKGSS